MILAILVGSQLGIIPLKSESNWPKVYEELAFKANYICFSVFNSGSHFVHQSRPVLDFLVEDHLRNIPMKFE